MTINQLIDANVIEEGTYVRLERVQPLANHAYFECQQWTDSLKIWMQNKAGGCVIARMIPAIIHESPVRVGGHLVFENTRVVLIISIIEG